MFEFYEDEDYAGWAMELCPRTSKEQFIHELNISFNFDGYSFFQDTYSMTITDGQTNKEVQVIFPDPNQYGSYKVILKSTPLMYKAREEIAHQELFWRIYHKITCKRKRGFWIKNDGTWKPIPKFKRLRQKRKK